MIVCDIPHGGSGTGISTWIARGTGCLIAADLSTEHSRKCTSQPMLIGTMVHIYLHLWRSEEIKASEEVYFTDSQCGENPPEESQAEAYRLFCNYSENEPIDKFGPVIATELHLSGPEIEKAVGVSPYTAQIDLLAGTKDDCTLVDYKTSRASGNSRYLSGSGRLQLQAYYYAARAAGYNVKRIVVEQLTKTKTPKVNTYEIPIPNAAEKKMLHNFLQGAKFRFTKEARTIWLPSCDTCAWYQEGLCLPYEKD